MKATDIIWETDGVDVDLPTEVEIPTEIEDDDDAITDYLSDTYGQEDAVEILEQVSYDVTGNIIYPIAQIANPDATEAETEAAAKVIEYFTNDDAKALYDKHLFDTENVE